MYMTQIRRILFASVMLVSLGAFAPAHAAGLQIADPSGACATWSWNEGTATLTCNAAPTVPGGPGGCSVARTPSNSQLTAAGGSVTLTGNCTGPAATSWTWTKGGSAWGSSANAQSDTLGANDLATAVTTTYVGTPSNNGTPGSPITATFTTAAGTGTGSAGGGGGLAGSCPLITKTIPLKLKYVQGFSLETTDPAGGFFDGEIVVASFTTPANLVNSGSGTVVRVGWLASSSDHSLSISTVPCDFSSSSVVGLGGGPTPKISIVAGTAKVLKPNTTYYVNVTNTSCGPGINCSITVSLQVP